MRVFYETADGVLAGGAAKAPVHGDASEFKVLLTS